MYLNGFSLLWAFPFGSGFSFIVLVPVGYPLQSLTLSFFLSFFNRSFQPQKNSKKVSKAVVRRQVSKGVTSSLRSPLLYPVASLLLSAFKLLSFFSFFLLGLLCFVCRLFLLPFLASWRVLPLSGSVVLGRSFRPPSFGRPLWRPFLFPRPCPVVVSVV